MKYCLFFLVKLTKYLVDTIKSQNLLFKFEVQIKKLEILCLKQNN